ncbi:MAG: hypothetical protein BWZ07_02495 [Alphaproteobacteria bacterium ADurb.BinA280]|nr:MAG: hypothetical protein BWZ07_02495 [Alphaproteobacteria bacterium ADurb.BinA280]
MHIQKRTLQNSHILGRLLGAQCNRGCATLVSLYQSRFTDE